MPARIYPREREASCNICDAPFTAAYYGHGRYRRTCSDVCRDLAKGAGLGARDLSAADRVAISAAYREGTSFKTLMRTHHIGTRRLRGILTDAGIDIRDAYAAADLGYRRWHFDKSAFTRRDATIAYWAGFLVADGALLRAGRSGKLGLHLQWRDRDHVQAFAAEIGLPAEVVVREQAVNTTTGRTHPTAGLWVQGPQLLPTLEPWAVIPRKTWTWQPPIAFDDYAPADQMVALAAYLRGWFDGDGSGHRNAFIVLGSKGGVHWYADALRKLGYAGTLKLQPVPGCWQLRVAGAHQVNRVRTLLHQDGGPRLERKWVAFAPEGHLVDSGQLAGLLRVSQPAVWEWTALGLLPVALVTPGGHHRYDPEAVLASLGWTWEEVARRVLSRSQLASALGVSASRVSDWKKQLPLPARRLPGGGGYRYDADEVREWLAVHGVLGATELPPNACDAEIRAWAHKQGLAVGQRGRVPGWARTLYARAQIPTGAAPGVLASRLLAAGAAPPAARTV